MFYFIKALKPHFQQYFSYIVPVSVFDGGNRSTHGKPLQVTDKLYHIKYTSSGPGSSQLTVNIDHWPSFNVVNVNIVLISVIVCGLLLLFVCICFTTRDLDI